MKENTMCLPEMDNTTAGSRFGDITFSARTTQIEILCSNG